MTDPRTLAVAGIILFEGASTVGLPAEITALGRDFVLAGILFYFYRQIAGDFKKIVQDNAAALQKLADKLDTVAKCPYAADREGKSANN